jgi:ATP-dependent RNA helicase RhlE
MTFADFNLNKQLLSAIEDLQYTEPTPIQEKAIPAILAGHDILGMAQTGTGKTAAFLLPILFKIKYAQGMFPRVLIFAPTRELAMQIDENITQLAAHCDIRHTVIYGGIGPKTQIETIAKGVDIIVATPGRFLDLYLRGDIVLKEVKIMVLDEADKMMDMGFMPQIRKILEIVPRKRQNLLFSATMPDKVVRLSEEFLEFPMRIEVAPQSSTIETVEQVLFEVPNMDTKKSLLLYLVSNTETATRVFVFVKTKTVAEELYKFLQKQFRKGVGVVHANKGQNTRINTMEAFRNGQVRVVVATDVAARGLDISLVSQVINFDVPIIYEDYVHRIGRTGRANNEGEAFTFVTKDEEYHIEKIEAIIRMKIPRKPLPQLLPVADTPFEESQTMLRNIDTQRKKEDPSFQGAFHEKKAKNLPPSAKKSPKRKSGGRPAMVSGVSATASRKPRDYSASTKYAKGKKGGKRS